MNTRLKEIIRYKANGVLADFAKMMGWSPQYLNRLTKGHSSIGLNPVLTLLQRIPELDARWLLFGEGEMIRTTESQLLTTINTRLERMENMLQSTQKQTPKK